MPAADHFQLNSNAAFACWFKLQACCLVPLPACLSARSRLAATSMTSVIICVWSCWFLVCLNLNSSPCFLRLTEQLLISTLLRSFAADFSSQA